MSASVKINGKTFNVTENLYLALQYLRLQDTDRIIWVDAICIDQSNLRERGHQVQQMGAIYSRADRVVVWLGSATDDTNIVMDILKRLEVKSLEYACKDWRQSDERWKELWSSVQRASISPHWGTAKWQRAGLESLLGRPWFKRVWILQEVACAKRAVICCGTKSVSARIFALAPSLLDLNPDPHCQAVLDIMPGPMRTDSWWGEKRDLYTLLLKFNASEASDPRDMVYALLGISSDTQGTDDLRADYNKKLRHVICDTASFLFGLSKVPYQTVPELITKVSSVNTTIANRLLQANDNKQVAYFGDRENTDDVAAQSPKKIVELLLEQQGSRFRITEAVVKEAAKYDVCGECVLRLLCEREASWDITDALVKLIATKFSTRLMGPFLKRWGSKVKLTEGVVKAAAHNRRNGREMIELLLKEEGRKIKITEETLKAAALNSSSGTKIIQLLLEQWGDRVKITEEIFKAAVSNHEGGISIMQLLLEHRGNEFKITEELLKEVASNHDRGVSMMRLLIEQQKSKFTITEEVFKAAARNYKIGDRIMLLILEKRGNEFNITEDLLREVAYNASYGISVMRRLIHKRGRGFTVTEELFKAAAGNERGGRDIIWLLLEVSGSKFKITEEILKAAIGNQSIGGDIVYLLLQRRGDEIKVTDAVLYATERNAVCGKKVRQLLLEHRASQVTQ